MIEILIVWGVGMVGYTIYKVKTKHTSKMQFDDVTKQVKKFKKIKDGLNSKFILK